MKDFYNRIDEFFRVKLKKKTHVATESDWQAMEQLLDSQSGDTFGGLGRNKYLLGILFLTLISVGGWFYWQSGDNSNYNLTIKESQAEQKIVIENTIAVENGKSPEKSISTSVIQEQKESKNIHELGNKNQSSIVEFEKDIENANSNNDRTVYDIRLKQRAQSISEDINNPETDTKVLQSELSDTKFPESANEQSENKSESNQALTKVENADLLNNSSNKKGVLNESAVSESQSEVSHKQLADNITPDSERLSEWSRERQSNSVNDDDLEIADNKKRSNETSNAKTSEDQVLVEQSSDISNGKILIDSNNTNNLIESINTSQSNRKFNITMFGGPAFISKTLNADNDRGSDYINRRENEEDKVVDLHFGIEGSYQFNNVSISTGIEFASYGEKINYSPHSFYDFVSIDTTIDKIDSIWVQSPNGGVFGYWEYDYDTSLVTNIQSIDSTNNTVAAKNGRTAWKYIEVPVLVRYGFDFGKMYVNAGIGGSVGILQSVNSYYLNPELTSLEEFNTSENYRNAVFNFIGAAGINYKIQEKWMMGIDIRFKRNISSVFDKNYPVKQKYSSIITGLSLSYTISK